MRIRAGPMLALVVALALIACAAVAIASTEKMAKMQYKVQTQTFYDTAKVAPTFTGVIAQQPTKTKGMNGAAAIGTKTTAKQCVLKGVEYNGSTPDAVDNQFLRMAAGHQFYKDTVDHQLLAMARGPSDQTARTTTSAWTATGPPTTTSFGTPVAT